jgi:uncharacterized membrane protein/protein-disulfide isomerase
MESSRATSIIRLLALLGLAVSMTLLMDHLRPNPRLCGFEWDCEEVLTSRFGSLLGVPLPVIGVVAFAVLLAVSLFPAGRSGRLLRPLALAAGVTGIGLILLQVAVLHRVCRFCLIADIAAIAIGAVALVWGRGVRPMVDVRFRSLWLAGAAAALGIGAIFGTTGSRAGGEEKPVPRQVRAFWVPDKVNVVEVTDFACPHCRRTHPVMKQLVEQEGDRIHFVRLTAPMPAHAQARPASRAFLSACEQGKQYEMAEALFTASDLSAEQCERTAAGLGLSLPEYRTCVADPATDARLDAVLAWVKEASPQGLPVIWVQDRTFFGPQSLEELRWAVRLAESRMKDRGR